MDIGTEEETVHVEPLKDPFEHDDPPPEPDEAPVVEPETEREAVPA